MKQSFKFTHHINAAMLAMMDLVVSHDGIAVGSYLDASQCIAVDVVILHQAPPLPEYVHAALMPVKYLILPEKQKL